MDNFSEVIGWAAGLVVNQWKRLGLCLNPTSEGPWFSLVAFSDDIILVKELYAGAAGAS